VALLVFALRELSTDVQWVYTKKYIAVSFWGLNIGLGLMVILNLFPSGVLQLFDVVNNGYWHARGPEFSSGRLVTLLEWLRMPADLVFIVFGVVPLVIAAGLTWIQVYQINERPGT
jgi:nitric oxide reductase subunit B